MKRFVASQFLANKPRTGWATKLVVAAAMLFSGAAYAGVKVNVTTTADEFGNGAGCSLREALYTIHHAVAYGGCTRTTGFLFDNINIPSGTYAIALPPNGGSAEGGGAFKVYASVAIFGAGAANTIIDGASIDSVFEVAPGAGATVSMLGMTIRGGLGAINSGGGINHYSGGTLTLQNAVVTQNFSGYGIASTDAEGLTLRAVTVSNNRNTGVYLTNYNLKSATTLIENTTISGNVSQDNTGGIEIYAGNGRTNSATIANSTIAYNTGMANGQNVRSPGGIAIYNTGTTVYLRNSILARNLRGDRQPEDCDAYSSQLISQGYNLIEQSPFCVFQGNTATDIHSVDPQLQPLFDYGSGVPTHAVFPGSPALNAGNPATPGTGGAACAGTDARGSDRSGVDRPCDIGAYEYHADWYVNSQSDANDINAGNGICETIVNSGICSFRAALAEANATTHFATIEVPAGHFVVTLPVSAIANHGGAFAFNGSYPLTIVGAGAGQTVIDGNQIDAVLATLGVVSLHGVTLTNGSTSQFTDVPLLLGNDVLINRSVVSGNRGRGSNGISVYGRASIVDSTISGNMMAMNANCFRGGGGLLVQFGAQLNLLNTTISNNQSCDTGGAIFNDGGAVTMAFTTIANNISGINNVGAVGGGVASGASGGSWHATTSIIANNKMTQQGGGLADSDCAAILQMDGRTLVRTPSGCTFAGQYAAQVVTGVDPLLSALLLQGGPTPTVAPLAASPVHYYLTQRRDCVDSAGHQILTDQRSMPRPANFDWGNPEYCDLGAFQGNSDVIFANGFE